MGYLLLWLETMALAWLLVAVAFSCSGRLKKWPVLWPILIAVLITVPAVLLTILSEKIYFADIRPQWLFPYTLSWTLFFLAGSWLLIRQGRRPSGETPVAATWCRWKLAGGCLVLLALQGITMDTLDNASKVKAIAAQTLALTRAQTLLPSSPAKEDDAAEKYDHAIRELGEVPDWLWNSPTDPAFDPTSDQVQNLLREKQKAVRLFKEAAQKPNYYQPSILSFDYPLPDIVPLTNATRLLALEARAHARNGQMGLALQNISTMEKFAEHLQQTPTLITSLAAATVLEKSKMALELILAEQPGRSKIKVVLPVKIHDRLLQSLRNGLVIEEAIQDFGMADMLINHPSIYLLSDGFGESFWGGIENKVYRVFFYKDDLASHRMMWKKIQEFTQKPYYQSGQELMEWENRPPDNSMLGILTSISGPRISKYFERATHQQTQFLLGKLGLATAAYRSDHGKYPATLNALVPKYITEIPTDPFSGEPLKMKKMEDGMILYGVGEDLKDDGGLAYDNLAKEGDIAFYLGSAYTERRLKPALEAQRKSEERAKNKKKKK